MDFLFVIIIVPFEEDERDPSVWFLDHNYVEAMNDMFKKVNGEMLVTISLNFFFLYLIKLKKILNDIAREKMIGWYHSGPKLRASDLEINELFKRYTPNPVLVIVDVEPKDIGIPTDAYFAIEEIKDVSEDSQNVILLNFFFSKLYYFD